AKEVLLAPQPPESQTVTVMGRGRQVIGGSLHASLAPAEARQIIFEGFFPHVPADSEPHRGAPTALYGMALTYVRDPSWTRHLSGFLKRHIASAAPDAILFNGGVFQPESLR